MKAPFGEIPISVSSLKWEKGGGKELQGEKERERDERCFFFELAV